MYQQLSRAAGALTAALAVTLALAGPASALSFRVTVVGQDVTDPNAQERGPASFTAIVEGLEDNLADQAATAFIFESFTNEDDVEGDLGLFENGPDALLWDRVLINSFTVVGGLIEEGFFNASSNRGGDVNNGFSDAVAIRLVFEPGDDDSTLLVAQDEAFGQAFELNRGNATSALISAIPVPAAAPLLIAGLGLLFGLGRRRKTA